MKDISATGRRPSRRCFGKTSPRFRDTGCTFDDDEGLRTLKRPSVRPFLLVLALTTALSVPMTCLGVPTAVLFAGLIAAMAYGLATEAAVEVPQWMFSAAQGLIGVMIGSLISPAVLPGLGSAFLPVLVVTVGTIAVSLLSGWIFSLRRDVSRATGAFAMIAGGASGIIAIAHELGADDRVVAVVQYLRVVTLLITMPLVTALAFDHTSTAAQTPLGRANILTSVVYTAIALGVGLLLIGAVRLSTGVLLYPMAAAIGLNEIPWFAFAGVPDALQWFAYALIGVQVGLRFTWLSVTSIARMLPLVFAIIAGMVAVTAGLGSLLAWATPVDPLTAYLATTPGGLFAVLAIAAESGSDVAYVMAAQVLRLLMVLTLAPVLARILRPDR